MRWNFPRAFVPTRSVVAAGRGRRSRQRAVAGEHALRWLATRGWRFRGTDFVCVNSVSDFRIRWQLNPILVHPLPGR